MFSRPGKTAPRLVEDLYNYDPRQQRRSGRNILTDAPPPFDESKPPMSAVPGGSCRHKLKGLDKMFIKPDQCLTPVAGEAPNHTTVYKVAACCAICRYHFTVIMDFREGSCVHPCPNEEYKQHHFLHVPSLVRSNGTQEGHFNESHRFLCSSEKCGAVVTLNITPPHITKDIERLLSDRDVLQARLRAARQIDPNRPDLEAARPVDPLYNLHAYIRDALIGKPGTIPAMNRKFLVAFGRDCDDLLEGLGFQKRFGESGEVISWQAPQLSQDRDILEGDPLRDLLDDTYHELLALIDKQPAPVKQTLKRYVYQPLPSRELVDQVLGSSNYEKKPNSRREDGEEDHPYYAGLGAVGDFSDDLLAFAYDRQVATDPENSSYYFECLQGVATGRNSESLDMKRAILASEGYVSRKDAASACSYFGFNIENINDIGDDHIISCFRSRLQDTSPMYEADVRQQLLKIGQYKRSQAIKDAASDTIETYDQALSWLGGEANMADDILVALAGVKKSEPGNEEKITQAIKIIAEYRKSDALMGWLNTGEINTPEMEVAKAYSIFGINDRTGSIDLYGLELQLEQLKQNNPSQSSEYERAAEILRKEAWGQGSTNAPAAPAHPPAEWPVGIHNLGNTCYLNAILQFLFTIKPFRELVLNIDEHMMEITPENMRTKKVGNLPVTEDIVRRSQDFVRELQQLFKSMIIAPGSTTRPKVELVQLALQPVEPVRPSGTDAAIPVASEVVSDSKSDETLVGDGDVNAVVTQENASGSQLAEAGRTHTPTEDVLPNDTPASDKENSSVITIPDQKLQDATQEPPADTPMTDALVTASNTGEPDAEADTKIKILPPDHPPPVPPRPNASQQRTATPKIQHTMQQDASEILSNVLYQLSCAIPADSFTPEGEQLDLIKDIFFGQERITNLKKDGSTAYETTLFESESVTVVEKPKHIYEAIDDSLDKSPVEGDSEVAERFTTLLRVPPILKFDVKRLGFDRVRKTAVRSEHHLGLEETICVDRYLDREEVLKRREESWKLKELLRSHRERRDKLTSTSVELAVPDALEAASQYISDIPQLDGVDDDDKSFNSPLASEDVLQEMRNKAISTTNEIEQLNKAIADIEKQITSLFADMTSVPYRLHALFIHRGGASSGHYLVSIRDFKHDIWRNYNDETITEVTDIEKNIFGAGDPYAKILPTCVVYVRADLKYKDQDLIEAICRTPTEDVEMENNSQYESLPVTEGVDPGDNAGSMMATGKLDSSTSTWSDLTTVNSPVNRSDEVSILASPSRCDSLLGDSPSKRNNQEMGTHSSPGTNVPAGIDSLIKRRRLS